MRKPERLSRYLATLFERLRHTSALVRAQAGMARPNRSHGSTAPDPEPAPRCRGVVEIPATKRRPFSAAEPIAVTILEAAVSHRARCPARRAVRSRSMIWRCPIICRSRFPEITVPSNSGETGSWCGIAAARSAPVVNQKPIGVSRLKLVG